MKPIAVRSATRAGAASVAHALETDPVGIGIEVAHAAPRDWRFAPATIEEMLEEALARRLPLAGGGSLLIEPVETLTAIDVNAGAASSTGGPERVAVATNMAAADAIARQVRLLNLSGALVIDFVGMRARGRQRELIDRLRAAFAGDPARPWIGSLSPIGLVEMSRRYLCPDLYERFGQRAD